MKFINANTVFSALQIAVIGSVNPYLIGKGFLAQLSFFSSFPKKLSKLAFVIYSLKFHASKVQLIQTSSPLYIYGITLAV